MPIAAGTFALLVDLSSLAKTEEKMGIVRKGNLKPTMMQAASSHYLVSNTKTGIFGLCFSARLKYP